MQQAMQHSQQMASTGKMMLEMIRYRLAIMTLSLRRFLDVRMPNASEPIFALTQCDFICHLNLWVIRAHRDIRPFRRGFRHVWTDSETLSTMNCHYDLVLSIQ